MTDQTTAYRRPRRRTWQERTEHVLDRAYDAYMVVWDVMPGIAAFAFLLWLINAFGPR